MASFMMNAKVNATSPAVRARPSEKVTPSRNRNTMVRPSSPISQDRATSPSHSSVSGLRARKALLHVALHVRGVGVLGDERGDGRQSHPEGPHQPVPGGVVGEAGRGGGPLEDRRGRGVGWRRRRGPRIGVRRGLRGGLARGGEGAALHPAVERLQIGAKRAQVLRLLLHRRAHPRHHVPLPVDHVHRHEQRHEHRPDRREQEEVLECEAFFHGRFRSGTDSSRGRAATPPRIAAIGTGALARRTLTMSACARTAVPEATPVSSPCAGA